MTIFDAWHQDDMAGLLRLIDGGADLHALDEHGWTILHWAAGAGDVARLATLVERGANPLARGRDNRTPYLVALAAGHRDAVAWLAEAEARAGGDPDQTSSAQQARRPYCKAYPIERLRAWPAWREPSDAEPLADGTIVFLHQDHSVTRTIVHGASVLPQENTPEWRQFCAGVLQFAVPADLDLLAPA